jgi:hypothetical protein
MQLFHEWLIKSWDRILCWYDKLSRLDEEVEGGSEKRSMKQAFVDEDLRQILQVRHPHNCAPLWKASCTLWVHICSCRSPLEFQHANQPDVPAHVVPTTSVECASDCNTIAILHPAGLTVRYSTDCRRIGTGKASLQKPFRWTCSW